VCWLRLRAGRLAGPWEVQARGRADRVILGDLVGRGDRGTLADQAGRGDRGTLADQAGRVLLQAGRPQLRPVLRAASAAAAAVGEALAPHRTGLRLWK
jgi:hypothetical protein